MSEENGRDPLLSGSEDVYRICVTDSETSWETGLMAFALLEERRMEWMVHHEEHNTSPPTVEEIKGWYAQIPFNDLLRLNSQAQDVLSVSAEDFLREILATERQKTIDDVIVREIKVAARFWRQALVGIVGNFFFALLLVAFWFIFISDASPVNLGRQILNSHVEETVDGKTIGE